MTIPSETPDMTTKRICNTCQGTGIVKGLHNWDSGGTREEKCRNCHEAPKPSPTPQADSQPECYGDCPTDPKTCANQCKFEGRAPHAPADSVAAPAAGAVAHTISDAQIEAMPVWRNFVGLWPESRREIVDAVVDLLAAAPTPPVQAADSVLEDAARYRWLREHRIIDLHANPSVPWVVRCEFQPIPTTTAIVGEALDAAIDVARKQGANHD